MTRRSEESRLLCALAVAEASEKKLVVLCYEDEALKIVEMMLEAEADNTSKVSRNGTISLTVAARVLVSYLVTFSLVPNGKSHLAGDIYQARAGVTTDCRRPVIGSTDSARVICQSGFVNCHE